MRYWYVCSKSFVDRERLAEGDVIGFKTKNPNISKYLDGKFEPMAEWIYIGQGEIPPIDDILRAAELIKGRMP